jgi:HEAT repeat protein
MSMRAATPALALLILSVPALAAGQGAGGAAPRVVNGRVVPQAVGGSLDATFQRLVSAPTEPAWIGYSVPTVKDGNNRLCCDGTTWISDGIVITNGRIATCGLEPGDHAARTSQGQPVTTQSPIRLEGPETMNVLFRVEEKMVQRIRIISPDCELDAGGRTITWLGSVSAADSVKLLSTFMARSAGSKSDRVADAALSAIAMHTDDQSVPELMRLARQDPSGHVRGQALFWIAQKAGQRAAAEITAAIENDPDTDVKKRAVFALSQLPKDEGVPLLIKVAKTNQNPAVRKQAIFWLGQSKDPRALDFFAEVLSK